MVSIEQPLSVSYFRLIEASASALPAPSLTNALPIYSLKV